jgi:hypothetical protein
MSWRRGRALGSEEGKVMGIGLLLYTEEGRRENFGLVLCVEIIIMMRFW